ncbi:MAG: hypothetical protein CMK32_09690 [Porticoccaceae bacterium]|nr:hypothetical protein [Porticoccaceae bacterium]
MGPFITSFVVVLAVVLLACLCGISSHRLQRAEKAEAEYKKLQTSDAYHKDQARCWETAFDTVSDRAKKLAAESDGLKKRLQEAGDENRRLSDQLHKKQTELAAVSLEHDHLKLHCTTLRADYDALKIEHDKRMANSNRMRIERAEMLSTAISLLVDEAFDQNGSWTGVDDDRVTEVLHRAVAQRLKSEDKPDELVGYKSGQATASITIRVGGSECRHELSGGESPEELLRILKEMAGDASGTEVSA